MLVAKDTLKSNDIDPLTPESRFFFLAVLPGQAGLHKKYWNTGLVYGAGTSIYFYVDIIKNTINTEMLMEAD
jgi:hypothetical protein